jgi:hypothetical protein
LHVLESLVRAIVNKIGGEEDVGSIAEVFESVQNTS